MILEIFMPFYGDIEHFKLAVLSVTQQTDPNWELTILDDQYPSEIPAQFVVSLKDARIKYIRNESNLGVSRNFQKCIDLAQAEYITIMGCDDLLLPGYVSRTKEIIAGNKNVSYIQPGIEVVDENGQNYFPLGDKVKAKLKSKFAPPKLIGGEELATSLMQGCWTYFPSIAWKTSAIRKFNFRADFRIVLDLALQLDLIVQGGSLYVDSETTFAYRRHRKSVSMESALNGTRFQEESRLFSEFGQRAAALGWKKAASAARLHTTSRINALLEIPSALASKHFRGVGVLTKHVFSK